MQKILAAESFQVYMHDINVRSSLLHKMSVAENFKVYRTSYDSMLSCT